MKLEKLTIEQEQLIPVIRDKWVDLLYKNNGRGINKESTRELIKFIYELSDLKIPAIFYVDSPLGMQYAANILKEDPGKLVFIQVGDKILDKILDKVLDKVWRQAMDQVGRQAFNQVADVGNQVWNQVADVKNQIGRQVFNQINIQIKDQVENQVWGQVWKQVGDQVENQVWGQIWKQVGDQVREKIRDQKLTYFSTSWYGNISDYGWLSFYDFFKEIEITVTEKYKLFADLLVNSNVYDMLQFGKLCIVCAKPTRITYEVVNGRRLLHQEKGTAIEWSDGYKLYFLYGVHFEEDLYKKVTDSKITFKELMSISNMEQRYAAMKLESNREKLLESGTLLDRSDRGNELYKVEGIFRDPAYFLRYECPSTGRIYVSGIDPKIGAKGSADESQAWKFGLAIDTYKFKLTVER